MDHLKIVESINKKRSFFNTYKTIDLSFRIEQLNRLLQSVIKNETIIIDALKDDLNKPFFEAYASEVGYFMNEIKFMIKHIKSLMKPRRVKTPPLYFGSKSYIVPEPVGVVLIIAPWNYPFQLVLSPLIGAIAAGNCVVIKPSEMSPKCSKAIKKIMDEAFDEEYISVIEGGIEESNVLIKQKFDHIFFTGSSSVGRIVAQEAAKNLVSVTLELGGKNPCIVDGNINVNYAARRIVWGKFFNAGQTCVAPDYLLVNKSIKSEFIEAMKKTIVDFYGENPLESRHYTRIISQKHFDRLVLLLKDGRIITGGKCNAEKMIIAPTIVDNVSIDRNIMKDEIFGPILPVFEYSDFTEAINMIKAMPKPLALYIFSRDRYKQRMVLDSIPFGGGCINDTLIHFTSKYLPFGGVGESGIGKYHGKASFEIFSNMKSVLHNNFLYDAKVKYPPYDLPEKFVKLMTKWL
ncbi:MAG TPA: aldehyde dehydrogenase [Clostridia bacterium]